MPVLMPEPLPVEGSLSASSRARQHPVEGLPWTSLINVGTQAVKVVWACTHGPSGRHEMCWHETVLADAIFSRQLQCSHAVLRLSLLLSVSWNKHVELSESCTKSHG